MKVLRDVKIRGKKTAVAIGYFDGVHIGHREVILNAVESGFLPVVLTFDYSNMIPKSKGEFKYIMSDRTRFCLFKELGVKIVVCPFFEDIKNFSFLKFFEDILVGNLNAKLIVSGKNLLFGKNRHGNHIILKYLAEKSNIEFKALDLLEVEGEVVSSKRIRKTIEKGDLNLLKKFLDRNYFVEFKIKNICYNKGKTVIVEHIEKDIAFLPFGEYEVLIEFLNISLKGKATIAFSKGEKILKVSVCFFFKREYRKIFVRVIFLKTLYN